jgi:hypothetical protein
MQRRPGDRQLPILLAHDQEEFTGICEACGSARVWAAGEGDEVITISGSLRLDEDFQTVTCANGHTIDVLRAGSDRARQLGYV